MMSGDLVGECVHEPQTNRLLMVKHKNDWEDDNLIMAIYSSCSSTNTVYRDLLVELVPLASGCKHTPEGETVL